MDQAIMGQYENEGGFLSSSQAFNSPSGGEVQEKKKEKCLAAVVIKQILESNEGTFKLGPIDVDLVTFVGIIRSVAVSSTKIDYTFEDDTGLIGGSYYIEQQDAEILSLVEDTYCRVYASARTSQGKRHLIVFSIEAVTDLNELVYHILEVVYCEMAVKEMPEDADLNRTNVVSTNKSNVMRNYLVDTSVMETSNVEESSYGMPALQQRVLDAIGNCTDDGGINKSSLERLNLGMSSSALSDYMDNLSSEGYIFQGKDEFHYKRL